MARITILLFFCGALLVNANPSDMLKKAKLDFEQKGVEEINGKFYYFTPTSIKVRAGDAALFCADVGQALAGFETEEESQAVLDYMAANGIGGDTDRYWLSGIKYYTNDWIWTNSGFKLDNNDKRWAEMEPGIGTDCTDCVVLTPELVQPFYAEKCESALFSIICEQP